jgi:phage gp36-like protein
MADEKTYYIDVSDLAAYMPAAEITNNTRALDPDSEDESPETNVDRIIKNVCGLADSYLQNRYDIPLKADLVTDALKKALCKMVIWDLSSNYTNLDEQTYKIRSKDNDDAVMYLERIASGKAKLDSTDETNELHNADKYSFDSDQRIDNKLFH